MTPPDDFELDTVFVSGGKVIYGFWNASNDTLTLRVPIPEDDEEPGPVGHLEILADLGMNGMEISALCDDEELFPDEQLEAIAARLGFGEQFTELLDL